MKFTVNQHPIMAVPKFFPDTFGKEGRKAVNELGFPMGAVGIRSLSDLDEENILIPSKVG